MKKVVIALGGNALGNTNDEQLKNVKTVSKKIVDLVENGYSVVITHGNGPQVGMINSALDSGDNKIPFPECNAMSQGYIGYHLGQSITNELKRRKINKTCVSVTTQVVVSKDDEAFNNPTKPIGNFLREKEAKALEKEKGYVFKELINKSFRRVVPSPKPQEIVEIDAIKKIIDEGNIVIACGGGGIPVIRSRDKLVGVDAVIDKDLSSSLLAKEIKADRFIILTNVDYAYLNYGKKNQKKLTRLDEELINEYMTSSEFAEGSMLPKIKACLSFTLDTGKESVITSLNKVLDGVRGNTGTVICSKIKKEDRKMANKKEAKKKNLKFGLTAFSIILILIAILGVVTYFLPQAKFVEDEIVNGSGVVRAKLSDILMAPILGFENAIDVCIFVFVLGGFLKIVSESGALEKGVEVLVRKLKGRELILIPILMFIFSVGGTTYGMLEETVGFYAILAVAMVASGMDTIVSSAVVLLGAGSGVLGSTVNPFAVGAAVDAATKVLPEGFTINQGTIIGLGTILWLSSLAISIFFVMRYAKKIIKKKGSTFLSLQEQKDMNETYADKDKDTKPVKMTGRQKVTLWLFAFTFIVMIIGFIPWEDLAPGVFDFFSKYTGKITGEPLGYWYFNEASLWFLLMTIVIGIVNGYRENKIVDIFIDGADDMVSVILVIAVARGASILMQQTHLDNYIIFNVSNALQNVPKAVFAPLNYILHVGLSVLVPSSSGLATLSSPIMGPLAYQIGYNVEVTLMEMVAANGLVNLFTPTCGAIMGGLALAKVQYTTWLRWAAKIVVTIAIANMIILTVAMVIL
jgi:carbamate kinase